MAKSQKYFEIPRGNEKESDNIRQALINKIKKQEQYRTNEVHSGRNPQVNVQRQPQQQVQQPTYAQHQHQTQQQQAYSQPQHQTQQQQAYSQPQHQTQQQQAYSQPQHQTQQQQAYSHPQHQTQQQRVYSQPQHQTQQQIYAQHQHQTQQQQAYSQPQPQSRQQAYPQSQPKSQQSFQDFQNRSFKDFQHQKESQLFQDQPIPRANPNQYSSFGAYSSPFADTSSQKNDLVDATHSNEPVKYKPKKRKSAGKTILVLILMLAVIFGLSWTLREFVFQAYEIPSGSMEKTIMTGDMVFAEKVSVRFSPPKAGDIVTFKDPQNDGRILIKRVIATAGQTVDIKDSKLYIDNIEQDEPYVNNLPTSKLSRSSVTYPYKVPENSVWVMGDNRTNSQDSRYFEAIPTDSIIGHALFVYWPTDDWKVLE